MKWWAAMDREDVANMIRWLAGADLKLFLQILQDSSTDANLKRMYPARRKFMEGLLDHHNIVDARLFLSKDAQRLVINKHGQKAMAAHGALRDQHTSVIYVNIDNKIHFFEGTHNFAARGGAALPASYHLLSRATKHFSYRDFTKQLEEDLEEASNELPQPMESFNQRHHPNITWQDKLIWHFEYYGVDVDPETVLTPKDYLQYRRSFGL